MISQFYFVVIDTTESTQVRNLPRGIINTYIIKAIDENHAKQIILRTMRPVIAQQVANSMYVYPLDPIMYNIELAETHGRTLPLYSFTPLNGSRPPRVLNIPERPNVEEFEEKVNQKKVDEVEEENNKEIKKSEQQKTTVVPPNINPENKNQVRSAMFQKRDYEPQGQTTDKLSTDKEEIIRKLGVFPNNEGADEGINPKINSATGQNLNQTIVSDPHGPGDQLSPEQMKILQSVGAVGNEPVIINEQQNEDATWVDNGEYAEISPELQNGGMTEEQLQELQNEFKEVQQDVGIEVTDSVPGNVDENAVKNLSVNLVESNIDLQLRERSK